MISAVLRARARSLDQIASTAGRPATAAAACARPSSVRGALACPCQRPLAFQVDWPWRMTTILVGGTPPR